MSFTSTWIAFLFLICGGVVIVLIASEINRRPTITGKAALTLLLMVTILLVGSATLQCGTDGC